MCARCCVRLRPSAAPPLAPASSALRPVARRRFTRRRRVRLRSYWCSLWSFLCVGCLLGAPSGALSLRLPVPLVRYPLSCNLISADQGSLFPRRGFCFPCELSRMALVNHLCVGVGSAAVPLHQFRARFLGSQCTSPFSCCYLSVWSQSGPIIWCGFPLAPPTICPLPEGCTSRRYSLLGRYCLKVVKISPPTLDHVCSPAPRSSRSRPQATDTARRRRRRCDG